jgi:alanine racemase
MNTDNHRTHSHLIWAEVDLDAIAANVRELRRVTWPQAKLMAVVKANGYGHGAVAVAKTALAAGADWLGVARIDEAVQLRQAGIQAPVLVLGYTPPQRAGDLIDCDARACVYDFATARAYADEALARGTNVKVHLKVDTGMGRLGLDTPIADVSPTGKFTGAGAWGLRQVESIAHLPGLRIEGVFTHLASADQADKSFARQQLERFDAYRKRLSLMGLDIPLAHAANSAAIIDLPESHLDLVRAGIAIYGLPPSAETNLEGIHLQPAMALKARLVQVKAVPAGFTVSYGATHTTVKPTVVATVAAGYADGYSRGLSNRGQMLVHGVAAPVIGRVCMDLTMLDVGRIPAAAIGDEAVLFGRQGPAQIGADDLARTLGTISYEILTGIAARVPRIYLNGPTPLPPARN